MTTKIHKDEFDAALHPSFRAETQAEYQDLTRAWRSTANVLTAANRSASLAWRQRPCPYCPGGGVAPAVVLHKDGMDVVKCPRCGLVYSAHVLSAAEDRRLYLDSVAQSSYERLKRNQAYARLELAKCRYIIQELGRFSRPGTFLDIGAGAGRLLQAAADGGWRASGIEADPTFANECRQAGHDIIDGFFPETLPARGPVGAIAMLDVLEHSENPVSLLKAAGTWLQPDGVLVLQVPNFNSLLVQIEGAANSNFCIGHWNHFDAVTLEQTAKAAGYSLLASETIISELDKILAFPKDRIAAAVASLTDDEMPAAGLNAGWLHQHGLGYKILSYFRKSGDKDE